MMQNPVSMEGDLIRQFYEGAQTYESVHESIGAINKLTSELRAQKKNVYILTSLSKLGKSSIGSRKATSEALNRMDYDKIALYGASTFMTVLGNMIIQASGMSNKVHNFKTEAEARAWLVE